MRSFRLAGLLLLALAACSRGAVVDCTVPQAPDSKLIVRQLDVNSYKSSDTLRTDAAGHVRFKVDVAPESPEFVYVFYKDTRIASLLVQQGDRVKVEADTLGRYSVEGSEDSQLLSGFEESRAEFARTMNGTTDGPALARAYLSYYRECVKYVLGHPRSLTVIPVLYEQLDSRTPVFSQVTDALIFRSACDSLMQVWPESRFVKALEAETQRREDQMKLENMLGAAPTIGYPEIELTNVEGVRTRLSDVDAKVILLHFWSSSDAAQKMLNIETLLPLWKRWHDRGFEIFAVDINPDKAMWASVLRAQELPWINVNDGRGAPSAILAYNVTGLPSSFLLVDGELSATEFKGAEGLEKELKKLL